MTVYQILSLINRADILLGGGTQLFFSFRGVRPGSPKCGACELIFASEKGGACELKISKFGGL